VVGILALIVQSALAPSGSDALKPAVAVVNGKEYAVAVARSLHVDAADLTAYAQVESSSEEHWMSEMTAFAVAGVDPSVALVVRTVPGATDDAGPIGDHLLLLRGNDAVMAVCEYLDPQSEFTPDVCR